jgi:hypothetical protein
MKFSFGILALMMASVSAFVHVPSATMGRSTMMRMSAVEKSKAVPFLPKPENLDGSMAGDVGFDPVGFSNWLPLNFVREAEIKHGRVAMLATLGYVFAEFVKLPGDVHQVTSLEAHDIAVKSGALGQVLIWTSVLECVGMIALYQTMNGSGRAAGDFKFDPLGFAKDEKTLKDYQLKEVKNGRLAMLAFSGIVTQAALTGKGFPYM